MGIRDKPIAPASPWQNGFAERDRIDPARMSRSFRRLGRNPSAPNLANLCSLLQRHQNALVAGQRCTGLSFHSAYRNHPLTRDPRRTSSPLRSDLGFRYTQAYDTRKNEMDAAVSGLESAEAQLRQAANAVGYATLKADKAGIVTAVVAEPGQVVNAGQSVITLAHAGEIEIAVAIPEQDAGSPSVGQDAERTPVPRP